MDEIAGNGYLRVANEADRVTVASILFKNGYSVKTARRKKNGKTYVYYVSYSLEPMDYKEDTE